MRYAIVTETYPPEVNGVALTVQGLEHGLRRRGHDVVLVRPRQACDRAGEARAHEFLVPGAALPRYPGLRFGLPASRRLHALWRDAPPDALYVATEGPLGWSALRAARRLRIPVATGFHTRFDQYLGDYGAGWLAPLAMHVMRHFHNRAACTLVPTPELREFLSARGFRNARLLPRGVDTRLFDPARRDAALRTEWGVPEDGLAVVHVGRIAAEKNLDLAVRAFRALQRSRPDAHFVLVGDGPLRDRMQQEHPDFIFRGVRRGEDLARHFASADLFLFPSRTETFGNVTVEAMASGVPTIAFDYGAAREHLLDGHHGAAVAPGDDEAFIDAALRIGTHDALRRGMARAARAAMLGLDPERVAAEFERVLQSLRGRIGPVARFAGELA